MEIERKFLIQKMPEHPEQYKSHLIEQAYLNVRPVVRVRREDENYYMTYKGGGMMAREEYNLPLDADSYAHLLQKADGNIINLGLSVSYSKPSAKIFQTVFIL